MKTDGKIFEERRDETIDDASRVSWATNADYHAVFQRVGESYDLASCTDELYYLMP